MDLLASQSVPACLTGKYGERPGNFPWAKRGKGALVPPGHGMSEIERHYSRPNVARIYDYLLGGHESYAADREQAAGLLRICPSLGMAAFENRYFLSRVVTWAAGQGLTQFADLGAGAPVRKAGAKVMEDIHVTAQAADSSARVAYVDNDPIVLAHSRVFRAPARGVAVAGTDLADPVRRRRAVEATEPGLHRRRHLQPLAGRNAGVPRRPGSRPPGRRRGAELAGRVA